MHKEKSKNKQVNKQKNTKKKLSIDKIVPFKPKNNLLKLKAQVGKIIRAKKIVNFVKNGAKSIPNLINKQQTKYLLPKLEHICIQEQPSQIRASKNIRFRQLSGNLTNSMVMFTKKTSTQDTDLWAVNMQTQKCYQNIPQIYFSVQLGSQIFQKHIKLTRQQQIAHQTMYNMMDYLDQVQFNINQQVDAKIKIYMDFVFCMNCIQDLVNIDLQKISQTRKKTRLLRDLTVGRSIRINQHRAKKQKLETIKNILQKLKRMKQLQSKLNSQIMVGNVISHDPKNKVGAIYKEYCDIHNNQINKICCQGSTNLCKYWDVTYYVQKGFQQQFTNTLAQYISQIISPQNDIQKFRRSFMINKKTFMSTPGNMQTGHHNHNMSSFIDQSYQVDGLESVQLIVKQNSQRQIVKIFVMGMQRYNFSTQIVEQQLKNKYIDYINKYTQQIINQSTLQNQISLKQVIIETQQQQSQKVDYFQTEQCLTGIKKLTWIKYMKLFSIYISRTQSILHRLFSIIDRIIKQAKFIEQNQPQRYQIISSFMIQLIITIISEIDDKLCRLVGYRINFKSEQQMMTLFKSKTNSIRDYDLQLENMKDLIKILKKFQLAIDKFKSTYKNMKKQLENVYAMSLGVQNVDENQLKDCWLPDTRQLKTNLINIAYDSLHKSIITRDLRQKLQAQTWQSTQIPTEIYEQIGYIIGGNKFVTQQLEKSRDMLSSSIFLDKSKSPKTKKYNRQQYSSRFKVNNKYLTIDCYQFRLTKSTLQIIGFLKHYLQLYDETDNIDKQFELHGKITQLILMYNQYLKQLILKGQALKYGKIKGKSITAKHYLICYIQLQAIDFIFCGKILEQRIQISSQQSQVMHQKVSITKNEIKTKFRKILQMRILDQIESMGSKFQEVLQCEQLISIPKNFYKTLDFFHDFMLDQNQYSNFIDLQNKWVSQLMNKVGKGSKGKIRKQKCLQYLYQQLTPLQKYLEKSFNFIKSNLQ